MGKIKWYAKFIWLYTTSMFVPTEIQTKRVEAALKEYDAWKAAEAERKAAKA